MTLGPLTEDGFLGGKLRLRQPVRGYRAATDPVFLAAFVPATAGERVLDLGCGAGAALICLGVRVPGLVLAGLEVQPAYAALARENLRLNRLEAEVFEGDVARPPADLKEQVFDHVLTNPPFYEAGAATAPQDSGRAHAHGEGSATLEAFVDIGLRRLRPGGSFTIIHRTERLGHILAALGTRAGSTRLLPLTARPDRPAKRILVQAHKGGRGPLALLPPFVVHDGDGFSGAAEAVLARGMALSDVNES